MSLVSCLSVQSSVSARMVFFKSSKSSIEAAQKEKDTFRFLQMYSQVHQDVEKAKAVDLRKGLEPGSDRDKLVQEIKQNGEKMVMQASQFWGSLLTLVDPENHQELVPTDSDLTFDPQVLCPSMSLSKDNRKVFYHHWLGQCCATLLICSTKKVCKYQRWMISLSKESDWMIGLCDKKYVKNLEDGPVCGLCCKDNQLSIRTMESEDDSQLPTSQGFKFQTVKTKARAQLKTVSVLIRQQGKNVDESVPRREKVEVLWNSDASTLSFFRRTGQLQREEIITIETSPNNRDLTPFVKLGKENVQYSPKQRWQCSCGNVYNWDGYQYRLNRSFGYVQQDYCSCGKVLGGPHITEMVCELY